MFDFLKNKRPVVSAIVAAAGSGTRMKTKNSKQLIEIEGMPVVAHALLALQKSSLIDEIVIVTRESDILIMSDIAKEFNITKVTHVIKGGDTRTESVKNGIDHAKGEYVVIHDGARPCVKTEHIDKTVQKAFETGAAALGCPVADTIKRVDENGFIKKTVDRNNLWQIQTPQVFEKSLILKAYEQGNTDGATDDCMLLESIGVRVAMVEGDKSNIKVTLPGDLDIVSSVIKQNNKGE